MEAILAKIQKLIVLSKDGGASSDEADTAMAMANKLLVKYNLSLDDITLDDATSYKGIVQDDDKVVVNQVKEEGNWEVALMSTLAYFNMCKDITFRRTGVKEAKIQLIGKEHNIEVVKYLFNVARQMYRDISKSQYNSLRKQVRQQYPGHSDVELGKAKLLPYRTVWIRNFLKGCVHGLYAKLHEQQQQQQSDQQYGLMVVNNFDAIDEFINKAFDGKLKEGRKMRSKDSAAFRHGRRVGREIELTKGVESGTAKNLTA